MSDEERLMWLRTNGNLSDEEILEIKNRWKYERQIEKLIEIQDILALACRNNIWDGDLNVKRTKNTLHGYRGAACGGFFDILYQDDILVIQEVVHGSKYAVEKIKAILIENKIEIEDFSYDKAWEERARKNKEYEAKIIEKRAKRKENELIKSGLKNVKPLF